jgi:hypothetical protein
MPGFLDRLGWRSDIADMQPEKNEAYSKSCWDTNQSPRAVPAGSCHFMSDKNDEEEGIYSLNPLQPQRGDPFDTYLHIFHIFEFENRCFYIFSMNFICSCLDLERVI